MPAHGGHNSSLKTLLIIIVALLIIWGLFKVFSGNGLPTSDEKRYSVENAPQGQMVAGFPKELIPEEGVTIESSSELTYTDNSGQLPTVEYVSAKTLDENIAMFQKLLTDGGWTITKQALASEAPTTNFYAIKDGNDVNVTLTVTDSGVRVHIAYVNRTK
jgi:hypothetical protein